MSTAPSERAGATAGISERSAELGGALGIALLGSVVTFLYRGAITGTLGENLPPDALKAVCATLEGAPSLVGTLPDALNATRGVSSAPRTNTKPEGADHKPAASGESPRTS